MCILLFTQQYKSNQAKKKKNPCLHVFFHLYIALCIYCNHQYTEPHFEYITISFKQYKQLCAHAYPFHYLFIFFMIVIAIAPPHLTLMGWFIYTSLKCDTRSIHLYLLHFSNKRIFQRTFRYVLKVFFFLLFNLCVYG